MTQPPSGWPNGEPQYPQQGGWPQQPGHGGWHPTQPLPGPGGWQAPQQPSTPGGWPQQPDPGQYGWGPQQPGPGQPQGSWEPLGPQGYAPQPPRPRGRGKLIASAAVVVALAAGGVTTYIAMSDTNSTGAGSPREAVQSIVSDLNKSDLIGVLDDLAPGERNALANPVMDEIKQLKRLKVLQDAADPKSISGVKFQAKGLTFATDTVKINDHVQIVQLTGGTLDISADAAKIPFTHDFLNAAFPHGLPAGSSTTTHIDIGQVVRDSNGNAPIRIAAQKSGGKWYPSIFYTIADNASSHKVPTIADAIPAAGGSSPEDAVRKMVTALMKGDYEGAVKLLSPDELAVMHDYGGLLLRNAGSNQPSDTVLKDLQLKTEQISGGATRVTLSSLTVTSGGEDTTVKVDGSCFDVTANGQHKRMCTADLVTQLVAFAEQFGLSTHVTPAQRQGLEDLLTGLTKVGVDTSQSGGQWYVNPVRSWLDLSSSIMSGLQGNDLLELLRFFASLGN